MSEARAYKIKAATRDLVKIVGGVQRAADIASTSGATISRWQSANHPEIITIAAALALETDGGIPLITEALAAVHGRTLSDAEHDAGYSVLEQHAEFAERAMEAVTASSRAIADLKITPAEAASVVQELRDLIAVANRKIAGLSAIAASGETLKVVGK